MDIISIIATALTSLIGALGGGFGLFFWRENKQLKQAEAKHAEIINAAAVIDEWQDRCNDLKQTIAFLNDEMSKKNARIEQLTNDLFQKQKEAHDLELHNQSLEWHKCTRNGCTKRRPPRTHDDEEEIDSE